MSKLTKCPKCGSARVFLFRLDSDWAYGAGDFTPVNSDGHYSKQELAYDSTDRPCFEFYCCVDPKCDHKWF